MALCAGCDRQCPERFGPHYRYCHGFFEAVMQNATISIKMKRPRDRSVTQSNDQGVFYRHGAGPSTYTLSVDAKRHGAPHSTAASPWQVGQTRTLTSSCYRRCKYGRGSVELRNLPAIDGQLRTSRALTLARRWRRRRSMVAKFAARHYHDRIYHRRLARVTFKVRV